METKTFPCEGIAHLILQQVGRDARLQGESETAVVQITYQPAPGEGPGEFVVEGDALHFRKAVPLRVTLPRSLAVSVGEAAGELRAQGLDGPVLLDAVRGDLRLKDLRGRVQAGQIDGSLRADNVADLRVHEGCAGDLRVQGVDALFVETVAGDARLFDLGMAHLGHVRGDLWVEKMAGALEIGSADGDARLTQIGGLVTLSGVTGDVRISDLPGGLAATGILGDADLRGPFSPALEYNLAAAGDLVAYLPMGVDLRINVRAGGRVRSDIQLTPMPDGTTTFTASVGRGTGRLVLSAGGDVRIVQTEPSEPARATPSAGSQAPRQPAVEPRDAKGWQDLGERIQQQVSASLAVAGIDTDTGSLRFDVAAATQVARSGRPGRSTIPDRTGSSELREPGSGVRSDGPSEAELMAVLKMIEDGTIQASEAEALIKALGDQ